MPRARRPAARPRLEGTLRRGAPRRRRSRMNGRIHHRTRPDRRGPCRVAPRRSPTRRVPCIGPWTSPIRSLRRLEQVGQLPDPRGSASLGPDTPHDVLGRLVVGTDGAAQHRQQRSRGGVRQVPERRGDRLRSLDDRIRRLHREEARVDQPTIGKRRSRSAVRGPEQARRPSRRHRSATASSRPSPSAATRIPTTAGRSDGNISQTASKRSCSSRRPSRSRSNDSDHAAVAPAGTWDAPRSRVPDADKARPQLEEARAREPRQLGGHGALCRSAGPRDPAAGGTIATITRVGSPPKRPSATGLEPGVWCVAHLDDGDGAQRQVARGWYRLAPPRTGGTAPPPVRREARAPGDQGREDRP